MSDLELMGLVPDDSPLVHWLEELVPGGSPRRLDYAAESPDSVPEQVRAFAARGYRRTGRREVAR